MLLMSLMWSVIIIRKPVDYLLNLRLIVNINSALFIINIFFLLLFFPLVARNSLQYTLFICYVKWCDVSFFAWLYYFILHYNFYKVINQELVSRSHTLLFVSIKVSRIRVYMLCYDCIEVGNIFHSIRNMMCNILTWWHEN